MNSMVIHLLSNGGRLVSPIVSSRASFPDGHGIVYFCDDCPIDNNIKDSISRMTAIPGIEF